MKQELFNLIAIAPLISLICLAVHACIWWEGMVLYFIRRTYRWAASSVIDALSKEYVLAQPGDTVPQLYIDNEKLARLTRIAAVIIKPFYACLICMSSVWTIACWLLTGGGFTWHLIPLMLFVCGINIILDTIIYNLRGHGDDSQL